MTDWRSDAWVLISKDGKNPLCEEVADIIDGFFPWRPVKYESRWTKLVLKMAHHMSRDGDFLDEFSFREGEFLGRATLVARKILAEYQYIRTRSQTKLLNHSPQFPITLYLDEI